LKLPGRRGMLMITPTGATSGYFKRLPKLDLTSAASVTGSFTQASAMMDAQLRKYLFLRNTRSNGTVYAYRCTSS
jgi:hypothetical protein